MDHLGGLVVIAGRAGDPGSYPGPGENCFSYIINTEIELLIENKLIICALGNLHYKISREKFEPEPGFEPRTPDF